MGSCSELAAEPEGYFSSGAILAREKRAERSCDLHGRREEERRIGATALWAHGLSAYCGYESTHSVVPF